MAEYTIPISYVVSASTVLPQAGLEPLKMSTILLLTDEQPVNATTDDYTISRTASTITNMYGTASVTAQMANAIFGQNPNILANDGYLIVANYQQTQATAGTLTTGDISTNVEEFALVSDGSLSVTVDGTEHIISSLDFSSVTDLEDVAGVLNTALSTYCTVEAVGNTIVFTSKTTGTSSSVAIADDSTGTNINGANYLDGANATSETGTASTTETYSQAITRLASQLYFNGIITSRNLSTSEAVEASNTVQALQPERILYIESNDLTAVNQGAMFTQIAQSNNYTKPLLYTYGDNSQLNAKLFMAAYVSRLFSVNYAGSNTTITMNLKDLAGIVADTNISETILAKCVSLGVDVFPSVEGLPKVLSNRRGSFFIDQVQNSIWFKNAIQRAVFNTLAQTRTKIPQTEPGMQILINAISDVERQAVANGYLAPGKWNSPDTFGDLDDFHRNIEENGYYNYHQPVALQAQSEREQRKAPLVQIAGKEAGAIHSANILIYIEP